MPEATVSSRIIHVVRMTLFILRFFYYFLFLFGEQRSEYFLLADTHITKRDHGLFAYQFGIGIAFPVNDYIISG